jgi:hypothetical protein
MGQHPLSAVVLARAVGVLEIRATPCQLLLCNPCTGAGEILASRTAEERLEHVRRWPGRHPRGDQPRLPSGEMPPRAGHLP